MNKGYISKDTDYAKGGAVLGKESEFLKTKNRFVGKKLPEPEGTEDVFPKTGSAGKLAKTTGDKSLKPVKPRS